MHPHQVISLEDLPGRNELRAARPLRPRPHRLPPGFEAEYVNPFASATQGRIDKGVDFTGIGPIDAIGDAEDARHRCSGLAGRRRRPLPPARWLARPVRSYIVNEGIEATVRDGQRVAAGRADRAPSSKAARSRSALPTRAACHSAVPPTRRARKPPGDGRMDDIPESARRRPAPLRQASANWPPDSGTA